MKDLISWFFLVFFLIFLSSCGKDTAPVYTALITESGEHVEQLAGHTKDASVFKEQQVHKTLRNRDIQHAKMYALSGFNMEFTMQEVAPGVYAFLPVKIAYREEPEFAQMLPTKPSEHPVWATTANIFGTVAKYGLIGFGLSELSGVLKAGVDGAGNTFNGKSNIENSFNRAGTSQNFSTSGQHQDITPETHLDEDGKCWASPGCSCDSFIEGTCQ